MAGIIPRGSQQTRLTTGSPVDLDAASNARVAGNALSSLGGSIAQLGGVIKQEEDKQKEFTRQNTRNQASNAMQRISAETSAEARQNAAPDGSDLVSRYNESLQPKIDKVINSIPDNKSREELRTFYDDLKNTNNAQLFVKALESREQHNMDGLNSTLDQYANQMRENPTEDMAIAQVNNIGGSIEELTKPGIIDAQNGAKIRNAGLQKIADQWMQGLEGGNKQGLMLNLLKANQEDPSLATAINPAEAQKLGLIDSRERDMLEKKGEKFSMPIMTGKDKAKFSPEVSQILNSMDPKDKARWIDKATAQIKERSAVRMSDLNANVSGFVNFAVRGNDYSDNSVTQLRSQIDASGAPMQAKIRMHARVTSSDAVNKQLRNIKDIPSSELSSLMGKAQQSIELAEKDATKYDSRMKDVGNDFAVQSDRMGIMDDLQSSIKSISTMREADAASYVLQDPELNTKYMGSLDGDPTATQDFITTSMSKQKFLEIGKIRVMPKAYAENAAKEFGVAPDTESVAKILEDKQKRFGKYFPQVMAEITQANPELAYLTAAAYTENTQAKASMIANAKNKKVINTAFEGPLKSESDAIELSTSEYMNDWERAVITSNDDGSAIGITQTIKEQVNLEAKRMRLEDPSAGKMGADKLVERAYNKIVGSTFAVEKARSGTVVIPRKIDGKHIDTKNIKTYMDNTVSLAGVKEANLNVLPSYVEAFKGEAKERFEQDVAKNGKWITNSSQDGIILVLRTDRGIIPLKDSVGNRFEKKFAEIGPVPEVSSIQKLRSGFVETLDTVVNYKQKLADKLRFAEEQ